MGKQNLEKIKKWAEENPEKVSAYKKKWLENNKEKRKIICKEYNKRNKEKILEYRRKYRRNNPTKDWDFKNKDKSKIIKKISRSKRRAIVKCAYKFDRCTTELIKLIFENCPKGYHVDHIFPISKGGLHHPDNLQYLPAKINVRKSARLDFDCSNYKIDWRDIINHDIN